MRNKLVLSVHLLSNKSMIFDCRGAKLYSVFFIEYVKSFKRRNQDFCLKFLLGEVLGYQFCFALWKERVTLGSFIEILGKPSSSSSMFAIGLLFLLLLLLWLLIVADSSRRTNFEFFWRHYFIIILLRFFDFR